MTYGNTGKIICRPSISCVCVCVCVCVSRATWTFDIFAVLGSRMSCCDRLADLDRTEKQVLRQGKWKKEFIDKNSGVKGMVMRLRHR